MSNAVARAAFSPLITEGHSISLRPAVLPCRCMQMVFRLARREQLGANLDACCWHSREATLTCSEIGHFGIFTVWQSSRDNIGCISAAERTVLVPIAAGQGCKLETS
jgi:hypothetical protein